MAKLTKADIDGLVDGLGSEEISRQPMPHQTMTYHTKMTGCYRPDDLKRAFYLVAGLTAEGQPKPEPNRVLWYRHDTVSPFTLDGATLITETPTTLIVVSGHVPITGAGGTFTFIPDGAE